MEKKIPKKIKRTSSHKKLRRVIKTEKIQTFSTTKKSLYAASLFGFGLLGVTAVAADANAAVTIYQADGTNTTVSQISLAQGALGSTALSNPSQLSLGTANTYKYVAIQFTAKNDGPLTLGQLSSPVDTVMIFYDGIFDPTAPGQNAKVGNDDTNTSVHQQVLSDNGYTHTSTIQCGPSTEFCPQVKYTVAKGHTYTLLVSVFNGATYNQNFTIPFDFYANGDVIFGQYTGRTPINTVNPSYGSSNLYNGTTGDVDPIFVGGTLKIDQADPTYAHNFTLSNMAGNTIDANGKNSTFSGVLSNEGTDHGVITIADKSSNGGTVTFTGTNTYTGTTTLGSGGTLSVSQDANLGAASANINFNGGTLKTTTSFETGRAIALTSTGSLHTAADTTLTHSGVLTGAADWNKEGSGTLILNGTSVNTGALNVNAGHLIVGSNILAGTTAQVGGNVNLAGTTRLSGHGTVLGHVTAGNGSTVAPGSSIGTLNVGNITFNSGSTYELDAYPNGTSDKITATGATTVNAGAHLSVLAGAGTWNESTTYTIIDSGSGVTSTFDNMSTNMAFLTPSQLVSGNQLLLTLTRNSTGLGDVGSTQNQKDIGTAIGDLGLGNPLYDGIVSMDSQSANNAYNNLSGEIHPGIKSAVLTNSDYVRTAVNRHLGTSGEGNTGIKANTLDNGKAIWAHGWGYNGHLKADDNADKLDNNGGGILLGFDAYTNGTTVIGVAAGYEHNSLSIGGSRSSDAKVNSMHALAYGRTTVGAIDVKGGIGYSRFGAKTTRHVNVGSVASRNEADYNGSLVQIFAEGSHTFDINKKFNVTPHVGLAYQNVRTDDFSEKTNAAVGDPSLLHQNGTRDNVVIGSVGVRGQMNLNETSSLYADLGWQHTSGDKRPESNLHFTGGNAFTTRGAKINTNAATIGLGANIQLKPNMNLSLGYEGMFGNESRNHAGTVRLEFKF
ncbi:MAG: autotransporter domain-containing protein [Saezia sp.]